MGIHNYIGNSQRTTNTKRIGRPAERVGKGHPRRAARRARALARLEAAKPQEVPNGDNA